VVSEARGSTVVLGRQLCLATIKARRHGLLGRAGTRLREVHHSSQGMTTQQEQSKNNINTEPAAVTAAPQQLPVQPAANTRGQPVQIMQLRIVVDFLHWPTQ